MIRKQISICLILLTLQGSCFYGSCFHLPFLNQWLFAPVSSAGVCIDAYKIGRIYSNSNKILCLKLMAAQKDQGTVENHIDQTLKELYDWFGYEEYGADGYGTSDEENSQIDAVSGPNACAYGEITPAGFRKLASQIGLSKDDVFFDLGSGV